MQQKKRPKRERFDSHCSRNKIWNEKTSCHRLATSHNLYQTMFTIIIQRNDKTYKHKTFSFRFSTEKKEICMQNCFIF